MPYRKGYKRTFRKKSYGKKSWYNQSYTPKQLAMSAWRGVKYLKGLVNSEKYKFDATFSAAAVPDSGLVTHLTAIAQGDGVTARTGNSIFVRSVNVHGALTYNVAGAISQNVRVAIIIDTQQIGDTTPGLLDVYSATGPYGHINAATAGRFKIIWSKLYILDTNNPSLKVDFNLPMQHHVRFNGTLATDIQKGGIYIVASSTAASNYPTFSGEARVSYHDN